MEEFKSVLRNSKFTYLWTSQLLSQLTVNMMNFLLLTKLFTVTGSSIATSFLWLAYALPAIFFGPIGAASVDMVSKRVMLMVTNLLQALTVLAFIFLQNQSIFILYVVVLAYSLFNQFYVPAESASLPSVVSKKDLPHANSLFFMTQQSSLIIGFGVAGIVEKLIGFNGSLILCSFFLFMSFVSVSFLGEMKAKKKIPATFEKILQTFFDSIMEGYEFIKTKKSILFPLLLLLGIQAGLSIIFVNLPVIATQILSISVAFAGISIVVPFGIGALVGSIYIPKILTRGGRKKKVIQFCLALTGICMLILCLGIPFIPIILRVIISPLLIMLIGLGFVGMTIPTTTFLQETTPHWIRGRVFGNLWFLVTIVTVFPILFSGAITEIFGVRTLFVIMATGLLLVLIYVNKKGHALMEYGK